MASPSTVELVQSRFRGLFGTDAHIFRAPGRVNLIGEHTDYNDGFVMPTSIGLHTSVAAAKREDRRLEVYSDHFNERISLSLDDLSGGPRGHWSDFIGGVAAILKHAGHSLTGANLAIHADVPLGAGLGSSASLEIAVALALTSLSEIALSRPELAKLCQAAEHEYVGTHCGIMDQFSASLGIVGHALMLDCRSLNYRLLSIPPGVRVVICNSMVRHQLASGEYNRRRIDCETGVALLRRHIPGIRALRDVEIEDLDKYQHVLPTQIFRRCRHVIMENRRVLAAAEALKSHDAERFGRLMFRSHASLRDDYAVSCKELDCLVDLASSSSGVYGARMTGGGFGGCTVNLVHTDHASVFADHIVRAYRETSGITADIYVCDPVQST